MAPTVTAIAAASAALLCLGGPAAAAPPALAADLQRARTKAPRDEYRGPDQAGLSKVLNAHLRRAEERTQACDEWTPAELQKLMALIFEERHHEMQEIYQAGNDRRQMKLDSVPEFLQHWADLNQAAQRHPHLLQPLRESQCRQAVMWWTHHLTEEKRKHLSSTRNVTVPLLPEGPKLPCGKGLGADEHQACVGINLPNSCDWCHSTQAAHDARVPGTSAPDVFKLNKTDGPDDGNPHGWDRKRRCDQDQIPRCGLCEGVGGRAWSDSNSDIDLTPCTVVATPDQVNMSTVAPPLYPKRFTVRRKDGTQGGYSDTLIGWKTDPFCFSFFPQNDSIKPLCYRSQDSTVKYYDIEKEAMRTDYNIKLTGAFSLAPNITAKIIHVNESMWITQNIWGVDQCVCANPAGDHCTKPPCKSYVWHWDTFKDAQYLGRERIGAEWIQHHGTGTSSKMMELDHFILWTHHIWTDPASRYIVRAWKPFNGLQLYDPEAWEQDITDEDVFHAPPEMCKKGGATVRIHCDDNGFWDGKRSEGEEVLLAMLDSVARQASAAATAEAIVI